MSKLSYGLIGSPLVHSISPMIHDRLFTYSNLSADYKLFEISEENLYSKKDFLFSLDGFNVTIPHKRAVIKMLDGISKRAERCGAVNTVKRENGKLFGFNTDAEGFLRALCDAEIELCGNVVLCGCGGVARMMACEVLERGCALTIADRNLEKANRAKSDFEEIFPNSKISATELSKVCGSFDLILNGTPSGMYPKINSMPVSIDVISNSGAVFDAVGNPCETLLVKTAKEFGLKATGGLKMLVLQAVAAHEIWNGDTYEKHDINALYNDMFELTKNQFPTNEAAK